VRNRARLRAHGVSTRSHWVRADHGNRLKPVIVPLPRWLHRDAGMV
jgi:hypothetical protein